MFVKRAILAKQSEILNNEEIPANLKNSDGYVYRHLGNSTHNVQKMLDYLGCENIDQLMKEVVPDSIALSSENRFKHNGRELTGIDSETLMLQRINQLMKSNVVNKSFIG